MAEGSERALEEHLSGIAREVADRADIGRLLSLSAGRVLLNELRRAPERDGEWPDLSHVVDWLVASVINDEPWLKRLDTDGRPLKLMKFGSIAQMVAEADKAMRRARNRGGPVSVDNVAVEMELDRGYRLVRLATAADLDDETVRMGHCVGQGSYDAGVARGSIEIHSLRDRFGKSHATIESKDGIVVQIKGKENRPPKLEYFSLITTWLAATGRSLSQLGVADMPHGFVMDARGRIVEIASMRRGSTYHCDLVIDMNREVDFPVPAGITVKGNVKVTGDENCILEFPPGLVIDGTLRVDGTTLFTDYLPGNIVNLRGTQVECLPQRVKAEMLFDECGFGPGLETGTKTVFEKEVRIVRAAHSRMLEGFDFHGDLKLCEMPTVLPHGMKVGGSLNIECEGTVAVGSLEVLGNLSVVRGSVVKQPDPLVVHGNLVYFETELSPLSARTTVDGSFSVKASRGLDVVPADMTIGGDLVITDSPVRSLDGRTVFRGNLGLRGSAVRELADGLTVAGDLALYNSPVTSLPERMSVGRDMFIGGGLGVTRIPEGIRVGRNWAIGHTRASTLPRGTVVNGTLDISRSGHFVLPEDLVVAGTLDCRWAKVARIPKSAKIGELLACGSNLASLPVGFTVKGDLDVSGTPMRVLPEYLSVGGKLNTGGTKIDLLPDTAVVLGGVVNDGRGRIGRPREATGVPARLLGWLRQVRR